MKEKYYFYLAFTSDILCGKRLNQGKKCSVWTNVVID